MTEKVFHESITRASAYLWNLSEEEEEEESRGKPKPGRLSLPRKVARPGQPGQCAKEGQGEYKKKRRKRSERKEEKRVWKKDRGRKECKKSREVEASRVNRYVDVCALCTVVGLLFKEVGGIETGIQKTENPGRKGGRRGGRLASRSKHQRCSR